MSECEHGVPNWLEDCEQCLEKEREESNSALSDGVSPRRCLIYILTNWELYSEWCHEGRNPIDFLMTMSGRITDKDIEWAQKSLAKKAG